jgi:Na+/H+ antiporter NhaD/arsenite permease-like protein
VIRSGRLLRGCCVLILGIASLLLADPARAAGLDGSSLPLWVGLPFAGLLLSIALGPVLVSPLWHLHYDKAAAVWALLALVLLVASQGFAPTVAAFAHNMLHDYLPFILMLFALYTAAGGIVVRGLHQATPFSNCVILAAGALAASLIGTTGASMILIRPLLRANAGRKQRTHVVIFFIFLVSNIGGALSPLGDPPLFFGFLRGVDFFWPLRNLWLETLFTSAAVLLVFFGLDWFFLRREQAAPERSAKPAATDQKFAIAGTGNIILILAAVGAIILSAVWRPRIGFDFLGTRLELQTLLRDGFMVVIGLVSFAATSKDLRQANGFGWDPLVEVAKLFAAIFTCIIPVTAMLDAGGQGPFAPVIGWLAHADGTANERAYFWATGLLSSLLDNAPTYLVFYGLASGDAAQLMGPLARTLAGVSLGAVFMGALTYIGNAPNFMIYAMARRARVPMPGFFGYMLWSGAVLVPILIAVTFLFF